MNCREATELIDRIIFEDVPENAGLQHHLDACQSCSQAFSDALKARGVMDMVRGLEPVLGDPDGLTDDIMSAIGQGPSKTAYFPLLLQRMLAAASVAIFLLFGYEQYVVVTKVSKLEMQFSQIKTDSHHSYPMLLASTIDFNNASISVSEIQRRLSTFSGTTPLAFSNIQQRINQRNIK
ncbi:MAG: hypothetical protein NT040_01340 [Bacteroidetes bacterium]|nr:hypothetical protein [Bacteroidota bacterium]